MFPCLAVPSPRDLERYRNCRRPVPPDPATSLVSLPAAVAAALQELTAAIDADSITCRNCESLARALGVECRKARLSGPAVYRLLVASIGHVRRPSVAGTPAPTTPRGELMQIAIDAFFGVQP